MVTKVEKERPLTLRELSPDFDEWPERWMGAKEDREYGKKLLPYMEEFLNELLKRDLSRGTLKNYITIPGFSAVRSSRGCRTTRNIIFLRLTMLRKSVEMRGILPDGYNDMTERDARAFERTCELFEEFLKKRMKKK